MPFDTPACSPTDSALVLRLSGASNVGALVQLSLPAGWSWASGSGSFLTDSNGDVTVPAGQIIAGPKLGTIAATYGSGSSTVTTATDLAVVSRGSMQYFGFAAPDLSVPAAINSDFVRVYANWNSVLGVKASGELWVCYNSGAWTQVASGVDTGANQAAYIVDSDVQKAIWTSGGVLYLGASAATLPLGVNSGFVRVAAGAGTAAAVKANGDVWKWAKTDGWSFLGSGGFSGQGQIACLTASAEVVVWIKAGVLYGDSVPFDLNTSENVNFRYVFTGRGENVNDSGLAAIKANGDAWERKGGVWWLMGTGADLGPGKGGFLPGSGPLGTVGGGWWLKSGVIMNEAGTGGLGSAQNHDIVRLYDNGRALVAARSDGQAFRYYAGWGTLDVNVSAGVNQIARAWNSSSVASQTPIYYIQSASSC